MYLINKPKCLIFKLNILDNGAPTRNIQMINECEYLAQNIKQIIS